MINSRKYLLEAFSEGSQAHRYLVFAGQAEKEGYHEIAALFRGTAQAETVYVHAQLQALRLVRATVEGFWEAQSGEKQKLREISPVTMVGAGDAGSKNPPERFASAHDREKRHAAAYRKALERLALMAKGDYFVCSECGYTCDQKRPEKCLQCQSEDITPVKVG